MKTYLPITLLLIFALLLFDCSNKGTEPSDELPKYENKIELVQRKLVDSVLKDFPIDSLIIGNHILVPKVTLKNKMNANAWLNVIILRFADTIYYHSKVFKEDISSHIYYFGSFNLSQEATYNLVAEIIENGTRTEMATSQVFTFKPDDLLSIVSKDKYGNDIIKDTFKVGEKIIPRVALKYGFNIDSLCKIEVKEYKGDVILTEYAQNFSNDTDYYYFSELYNRYKGKFYVRLYVSERTSIDTELYYIVE